jgi:hypothetical protein
LSEASGDEFVSGKSRSRLSRTKADFSPLDFSQRFTGTFDDDGRRIRGRWEICRDGSTWEHDFDLVYRRVG